MNDKPKLNLTDTEWMSIIDQDRDGLPPCCGNISALRDSLISIARNGGKPVFYSDFDMLRRHLGWCFPGHDAPTPLIEKIMEQVDFKPTEEHDAQRELILP